MATPTTSTSGGPILSRVPLQEVTTMESEDDDDKKGVKRWWKERTLWTRIWQGVAIASFVVNIVAMVLEASAVAILAGIVALFISPVVFYFQIELQAEGSK
jgi:hypothetical protein